jgi:hypothetical protein
LLFTCHFDCVLGSLPVEAGASWEKKKELDHGIGEELFEVLLLSWGEGKCGQEFVGG